MIEFLHIGGGSGHLQVAKALGATEKNLHKLVDSDKTAKMWDKAGQDANIKIKKMLIKILWLTDARFYFPIFFKMLFILFKKNPKIIVNTQFLCLGAICKAIRLYNFLKRQHCIHKIYLTDLPTKYNDLFFGPLKKLSKKDLKITKVFSPIPLKKDSLSKIEPEILNPLKILELPVRKAFFSLPVEECCPGKNVILNFSIDEEKKINAFKEFNKDYPEIKWNTKNSFYLKIKENDFVWLMLLSSFPPNKAIISYSKIFLNYFHTKVKLNKNYYFLIFCGNSKSDLFFQIIDLNKEYKNKHVYILPITFQEDNNLAKAYFRANILHTSSGGATAMEHLVTHSRSKIPQLRLIHSALPTKDELENLFFNKKFISRFPKKDNKLLFKEMELLLNKYPKDIIVSKYLDDNFQKIHERSTVSWELGNINYLSEYLPIKIISPYILEKTISNICPI